MKSHETIFTVPTYRLRDVAETVEKYFHKDKKGFPQLRVKNKKLKTRNGTASRAG